MRRLTVLLGVLLTVGALATQPVSAHGTCGGAATWEQQVELGPYVGYLQITPAPLIAGEAPQLVMQLFNGTTYEPAPDLAVTHRLVASAGDEVSSGPVEERSPAMYGTDLQLGDAGGHTLRLEASEKNATKPHALDIPLDVYPDLPVRFQPANLDADPVTGRETELRYYAVSPDTNDRVKGPDDLRLRFDLVSADGKSRTPTGESDATYRDGVWVAKHTFDEVAVYEVRFASESMGFSFEDTPPDKVCTLEGADTGATADASAETPAVPVAAVLAVLGVVAFSRRR